MKNTGLRGATVLIVLALCHECALAQYAVNYANVDVSRWRCLLCEFEKYGGANGQLSIASVLTTNDSDRFGRHGSYERAGIRSVLNTRLGISSPSGWMVSASAANLGLDSNDIAIKIKDPRSLEATFRIQQYRRLIESEALTPFHENGRLTLGPAWHRDLASNDFSSLATSNRLVELATTRRLLESTVSVEVIPRIDLLLGTRSSSKEGVQETFRDGILQSTAVPKMVDQESAAHRIQVSYRSQSLNAAWSRSKSTFENNAPLLRWESPYLFGLLKNESANAFSREHTSETFDLRLSLPHNSMLRIHERHGKSKSTAQSLKYGFGSLIVDTEPIYLFAERQYQNRRLLLTTRLPRNVEVTASHLEQKFKDLRPITELTPALGGLFLTPLVAVRPGDFTRTEAEVDLNFNPISGVRVLSKIWDNSLTRTNQEIADNRTRGFEVRSALPTFGRWASFATLRSEFRDASDFQAVTRNNVHTRRFHQAEMKRRVWSGELRYRINKKDDFVSLEVDLERHDYPESVLGMSDRQFRGFTLGYALRLDDVIATNGYIASHKRFATINGSQRLDLSMPWTYSADDAVNSAGLKLTIKPINKIVDNILVDYALSDGEAALATLFNGSTSFYPVQISRQQSLNVSIRLRAIYGTMFTARVYFEAYDARDWSIDNITQTTLSNVLTLARRNIPYDNVLFSLQADRSF